MAYLQALSQSFDWARKPDSSAVGLWQRMRRPFHRLTSKTSRLFWQSLAFLLSLGGVVGYTVFSQTCQDMAFCNLYHPYIIIFPVSELLQTFVPSLEIFYYYSKVSMSSNLSLQILVIYLVGATF